MAEAMECLCKKPELQSNGHEASTAELSRMVTLSYGNSLDTKGRNLEIDYFREELFHVCDEVT